MRGKWLTQAMSSTISPASTSADARRVSLLVGVLFGLTGLGSSSAAIALPVMASDFGVSTGVECVGDQPVRPDARGRHGCLRADLRPRRGTPATRRRRRPDDRRCAGGSAGPELRDIARRADRPGRRSSGRAHTGRGHHQRALLRIRSGDGPRPSRRLRCRGELHRPPGRRCHRGTPRLACGDRPADAGRPAPPAAVALGADRGQRRPAGPVRRCSRRRDRRRCGAARAVPLDRPDRRYRRRSTRRPRRTGRRCVGPPSPERLPAGHGDPQPRRRTQCARGRSSSLRPGSPC